MIKSVTNSVALQMGLHLSEVQLIEGERVACSDASLLHMFSDGHMVSAIVYLAEYDDVLAGRECNALELRIMSALSRLKLMLQP